MNENLENWLSKAVVGLKSENLYKPLVTLSSPCGRRITVNGRPNVINLASNNYLGLAGHPTLREAAVRAIEEYGVGAGAVRPITGNLAIHNELEERLAHFKHVPAALVFQSGFAANSGTIPAVMEAGDLIVTDELNHASIIDAVRLSRADRKIYRHSDMESLRECLVAGAGAQKRLIVTDGVFSMDGDIAPLPDIVALAREYDAAIMVDDAHGSGVLGGGRGTAYHFGVHTEIDIQLGTLSKAIGVVGGYIAGSAALKDWLTQRARPFLFSTAPPPPVAGAIIAAIDILETSTELTDTLWENTRRWKAGLLSAGFDIGNSETPITPVMCATESQAQEMQRGLLDKGVLALAIVFPTVPRGKARIRTMPSAMHTADDIADALAVFRTVGRAVGLIPAGQANGL